MNHCSCTGQCGRHEGACPEVNGQLSKLYRYRGYSFAIAEVYVRADGLHWCRVCYAAELKRQREAKRSAQEREASRQGRLF